MRFYWRSGRNQLGHNPRKHSWLKVKKPISTGQRIYPEKLSDISNFKVSLLFDFCLTHPPLQPEASYFMSSTAPIPAAAVPSAAANADEETLAEGVVRQSESIRLLSAPVAPSSPSHHRVSLKDQGHRGQLRSKQSNGHSGP